MASKYFSSVAPISFRATHKKFAYLPIDSIFLVVCSEVTAWAPYLAAPLSLSLSPHRSRAMSSTPLIQSAGGGNGRWGRFIDGEEAKRQLVFAVPMILTNISYYSITVISLMFAGHLGDLELAGATLASSWSTVTGIALMVGLSGGLETLCGQGYGAKLYRMLGIYLQSSIITSIFFSVFVSISWYYSETVFIWLHQDPEVSKMAALYLKYLIPALFSYGFLQCILRFLQTQSVVVPLVLCSVASLIIHVGVAYLLVNVVGLGYKGASLSASISLWISVLMPAFYIRYSEKFKYTWEGFSLESFQYVIPNMKLAIPSALMVCLEYWAIEILVLLAGLMPNSERSTSLIAICVNTEAMAYMITNGFSAAVSTRVSNELGAGNTEKAKSVISVTLKLSIILSLTVALLLAIAHNIWASFFSSSIAIIREFSGMTPLLAVSILLDSAQGILSGVSRGCGWQHLAAWTNLVAFYAIGMPLALLFGFKLGLYHKGLWIGLICGLFCQSVALLVITLRINWAKLQLTVDEEQDHILA